MSATLDARLCLLDYLHRSPQARSVQEILTHLQTHSSWGQDQLARESQDQGMRTVQLWLKQLRESSEFGGFVEAMPDPANRRRLLYQTSGQSPLKAALSIEEALLIALAERHLELVIPNEFRAASLDTMFAQAHETIRRYENRVNSDRPAVGQYFKSVAVHPRGQMLVSRSIPYRAFAQLSSALLHKRCISLTYKGRKRFLHPCAIVLRTPKLYLIAIEDVRTNPDSNTQHVPKAYQSHYMQGIDILQTHSRVHDFDLQHFIDEQQLEVPLHSPSGMPVVDKITLRLHIHSPVGMQGDTLIDDLRAHPLSMEQQITLASNKSHHILTVEQLTPTEALASWILGRLDRIEVVSPSWLRQLIGKRIEGMYRRYV